MLVGLQAVLAEDGIQVIGPESNPDRIIEQAQRLQPDVVLLDLDVEGRTPDDPVMRPGEGVVGRVFVSREPLIVKDYQTWEGRTQIGQETGLHACLAVPLVRSGRALGALGEREPQRAREAPGQGARGRPGSPPRQPGATPFPRSSRGARTSCPRAPRRAH